MPTITFMGQPVDPFIAIGVIALVGWVISTLFWLWIAYFVLKAAIRDGIKESGVVRTWSTIVAAQRARDDANTLPEIRVN